MSGEQMPRKALPNAAIPTWRGHYAGFASRLVAIIIDFLILAVVLAITFLLYDVLITNIAAGSRLVLGRSFQENLSLNIIVTTIVVSVTSAIYFIFLWTTIGSTIGGVILGIKLVNAKGEKPNILQAFIRYLLEFAFFFLGMIGSIGILLGRRHRALFDLAAGTYVVYNWDAKPDEAFLKPETEKMTKAANKE
jgi:uncharacterized RDD family membrane protein YckC